MLSHCGDYLYPVRLKKGGQIVSCDFGGVKRTIERALQNQWDWSGLCPFRLRTMTGRGQREGKRITSGAGSKTNFGEEFYCMCSSP